MMLSIVHVQPTTLLLYFSRRNIQLTYDAHPKIDGGTHACALAPTPPHSSSTTLQRSAAQRSAPGLKGPTSFYRPARD